MQAFHRIVSALSWSSLSFRVLQWASRWEETNDLLPNREVHIRPMISHVIQTKLGQFDIALGGDRGKQRTQYTHKCL